MNERQLAEELAKRLRGPAAGAPARVVWSRYGSEVCVHVDSLAVRILARVVAAGVELETDEISRARLVAAWALPEEGGLLATSAELPSGPPALVSSWGETTQDALWGALLGLLADRAAAEDLHPRGLKAEPSRLTLLAGEALAIDTARKIA